MSFADELKKNYKSEQQIETEKLELKKQKRIESLNLLLDYVVDFVKKEAMKATKNSKRMLVIVPTHSSDGAWGRMDDDIGCWNVLGGGYDPQDPHCGYYQGGLSHFVHFDDYDYFASLVYAELEKCGFNDISVAFVPHYEHDDKLLFKGKFLYKRLQIKISW